MNNTSTTFEQVLDQEKNELTEALILFGEGKRVNKALADLEMNRPEFYKFYEAGQQSRQEEINNLVMSNHHLSMQLADSGNFYDYEKKRADELQNMVVKVLAELESIPYWDRSGNCETAIKLLKVAS